MSNKRSCIDSVSTEFELIYSCRVEFELKRLCHCCLAHFVNNIQLINRDANGQGIYLVCCSPTLRGIVVSVFTKPVGK